MLMCEITIHETWKAFLFSYSCFRSESVFREIGKEIVVNYKSVFMFLFWQVLYGISCFIRTLTKAIYGIHRNCLMVSWLFFNYRISSAK